jgi:hypothetical protein
VTSPEPESSGRTRKSLRAIALVAGIIFTLLFLLLAGNVAYNLTRPILISPAIKDHLAPQKKHSDGANVKTAFTAVRRTDAPTTTTRTSGNMKEPLIPDNMNWHPRYRQPALRLNEQYEKMLAKMRDYQQVKEVKYQKNYENGKEILNSLTVDYYQLQESMLHDIPHPNEWDLWFMRMQKIERELYDARLELLAKHQRWFEAAHYSRQYHYYHDWDREVYYWRQMGPVGRTQIAKRSSERMVTAIWRSVKAFPYGGLPIPQPGD